jgi:pimeloyl-ACP methyl ester carboxylesterase
MGGPILLEMYASRPGRVASLTIAGGFYDNRATAAERLAQTEQQLQGKTMLQFGHEYAKSRLQPATPQKGHDELAQAVSMVTPKAYMDTLRAISTVGFQGLLAAISVPTLIVFGDKESPPLQEQGRRMAEVIPGARLEVIAAAGHLSSIDQPAKFAELAGGFIDSVGR